jgi:hypothetical protein
MPAIAIRSDRLRSRSGRQIGFSCFQLRMVEAVRSAAQDKLIRPNAFDSHQLLAPTILAFSLARSKLRLG